MRSAQDVLGEDRLLWEFWLHHGYEAEGLRARLRELPPDANGDYLAANSLYGCFEEGLLDLLSTESAGSLLPAARRVAEGPAPRVTLDDPEGKLLALVSLRPERGRAIAEAASRVRSWPAFHRAVGRANLVTAAAPALALGGDAVDAGTREALTRAAAGIRARNERLLDLLSRLLDAFAAAGLTPILLKETALQQLAFTGPGDRMIGDLDILFADSEVDAADRILESMGYASFEGIWSRAWYREHHHHLAPRVSAAEAVKIEPHTGIWIPSGSCAPILPEMIAASRPHPRLRARRPAPAHILFHLLIDIHGNVSIGKMYQVADVAALLRVEGREIDPSVLTDLAQRTGATAFLEDSLFVLARAYGEAFIAGSCPGLERLIPRRRPTLEHAGLRRLALMNLCGFEPSASPLSIAGIRLLHKTLLRPGGRSGRVAFLLRALSGGEGESEGMGDIARRSRNSRAGQLARAATFPFRAAYRAVRGWRRS
ncbi:MAG: nucleotidyltransferase family protein [Acidobacteria bacterium]|nr:nucleotidyltransferase family protein [Acidobacteriota bacterium]